MMIGRQAGLPGLFQLVDRAPGGRSFVFRSDDVRPLGYEALAAANLRQRPTIPLEFIGRPAGDEAAKNGQTYTINATLESAFASRTIALVKGGWLPSALAVMRANSTILADRNVVTEIVSRFGNGKRNTGEPDFFDLLAEANVRINPLLYALEGNRRNLPDRDLLEAQLEEAVRKIRAALPSANVDVGPESLKGALGLLEDFRLGLERKKRLLMRMAPALSTPVAERRMSKSWAEVLAAADQCEVPRRSLVVLAALSCVVVPNGRSVAKGIFKFSRSYSEEDAYSALVDFRSLELLICALALFPDHASVLFTGDKKLALFWAGIRPSDMRRTTEAVSANFSPIQELFGTSKAGDWQAAYLAALSPE